MKTLAFLWFFMILKNLRKVDKGKSWHINDFKCVLELAEQKGAWIIQIRHQWGFFSPSRKRLKHENQGREGPGKTESYIVSSGDLRALEG